jgi:hypothetical protein
MTHFEKINTDAAHKVGKLLKRLTFGCKYRIARDEIGDLAFEVYCKFTKPYKDPRKSDPAHYSDLVRDLYALGELLENYDERLEKDTIHALYCANALPIMRVIIREYERDPLANR